MNRSDKVALLSRDKSEVIKGIAIIFVFIHHLGNRYTRVFTPLGGIGVALFLLMSGYGLSISYENTKRISGSGLKAFWRKRFIGVWIPYILIELASFSLKENLTIKSILLDFTLLRPLFRLGWYLNYLLLWYIVFWVVNKGIEKFTKSVIDKERVVLWCVIAVILAVYFNYHSYIKFEQSLSFLAGIIIAYYPETIRKMCNSLVFL